MPRISRESSRTWAITLAIWGVFGLVAAATQKVNYQNRGIDLPYATSLLLFMPVAAYWALATPLIQWLGRRFPIDRGRWPLSLLVHAAVCTTLIFIVATGYIYHLGNVLPPVNPRPLIDRAIQLWQGWMLTDSILYSAVLGFSYAAERQRRLRAQELNAARLETQLAQAELQALRMQLHPHFLFNALHTIGALVRTGDRDNAVRVVTGLGDLLRRVLDGSSTHEVRLDVELGLVKSYLDIERVRFSDRLSVHIDVPAEVQNAMVPHLILQPLVENAIRHGIEPHKRAGRLLIAASRENGTLRLLVRDDGPNGESHSAPSSGIGLANTRARLERLYGTGCELTFGAAEAGGHETRIALPWHTEGAGA